MKNKKGVDSSSIWEVVSKEYETAKIAFPMTISNEEENETVLNTLYVLVRKMGDVTAEDKTEKLFMAFCFIKKVKRFRQIFWGGCGECLNSRRQINLTILNDSEFPDCLLNVM